jgi:hypothetical protein
MARTRPLVAFFGHHRCGTTWLHGILADVCRELRLRHAYLHDADAFGHDLGAFIARRRLDAISYVNADPRALAGLGPHRAFHVVRDPRDVVVSCYFAHRYSHAVDARWPELRQHRALLERLPKDEGLLHELETLAWEFGCMRAWRYDDPDVLELRFEDLAAAPYEHLLRVFRFLGLADDGRLTIARRAALTLAKGLRTLEALAGGALRVPVGPSRLPVERLLGIVWEHDFAHLSGGRAPGEEDPRSHYRKGVAGDWRNHFTAEHVARFTARYPRLLADLGYERDEDWGRPAP